MATKSFTTEFKFNSKSARVLARALEEERYQKVRDTKTITEVKSKERLSSIVGSFSK
ncbi:hypothetical protein GCM10022378_11760 [Salinicoccus jeotgali]|uniref:Uncharacterized protein n=1 Tax=Salinicoccus jeotgali TaxID=381634 RepID=A0ABP7ER28_9STAP